MKDSTASPTGVPLLARQIRDLCDGIDALAMGLETDPSYREQWLKSIRDRLALISHDLEFARFGLTTGVSR